MPRAVTGTGRVTVRPLLYQWPDRYCVLAYTSTGRVGDTAVVGYIPVPQLPIMSRIHIAEDHEPQRVYGSPKDRPFFAPACWLICTGWSGRGIPTLQTLDLRHATWTLTIDRTVELGQTMYGHDRLHVGRLTLNDESLMDMAVKMLG